jgi:hypothetical protein
MKQVTASKQNFVLQQGFRDAGAETCGYKYPALMFQPRVLLILVLLAAVFQSAVLFLCLAALLYWSALLPSLNPFDALYNTVIAAPKHLPLLTPAPAPRRFAQGLAATMMVAIALSLQAGWLAAAWIVEALLLAAITALVFGRFCFGSYVYHLIRHDSGFANRTLPWAGHRK